MEMIKNEFVKLITNKVFLALLGLLLFINGVYLYWSMAPGREAFTAAPEDYRRLAEELLVLSDAQKAQLVEGRLQDISEQEEEMVLAQVFFAEGFLEEKELYEAMAEDLKVSLGYSGVVQTVIANADKQIRRLDPGTYAYRLSQQTKEVYTGLASVQPSFFPSRGMRKLLDNPVMDPGMVFLMLISTFLITIAERQKQLSVLTRTTAYGVRRHNVAKVFALGMVCILATVLLFLESFFLIKGIYPFFSLSLPIQSLYAYCPFGISVLAYLFLYLALKILFYIFCTSVFFLIGFLCRRTVTAFLSLFSVIGIFGVLYVSIPATSYLAMINNVNPIRASQITGLLERYQCVNILGYAVDKVLFYVVLWTVLAVGVVWLGLKTVQGQEEAVTVSKFDITFVKRRKHTVSLFLHESYKAFIVQRLLLVLVFSAGVSYAMYVPCDGGANSLQEVMYNRYSEGLEGRYTKDIDAFIEKAREKVIEQMEESAEKQEGYQMALGALDEMQRYAEYLSGQKEGYYINNQGFVILTGGDAMANRRHLISLMALLAAAIMCFVQGLAVDYQNNEIQIIRSTPGGRKKYFREKLLIGGILSVILLCIFHLPELVNLIQVFGTEYMSAPAYSLPHLEGIGIPIFLYICLRYAAILLLLAGIMLLSWLVVRKVKNGMLSIVFLCAVVEIPLVVVLYMS